MRHPVRRTIALAAAAFLSAYAIPAGSQEQFRFHTGVNLINVTATVTDESGHFVPGLQKADFAVFEDEKPIEITHFSAERVPISLGIVVDTSGSMDGPKITAARLALDRFLSTLLGPDDEVFLYRFDNAPHLVNGWTTNRRRISDQLRMLPMGGATALYDAVAAALPLLDSGRRRKKALLVISDGNDTSSRTDLATVKRLIQRDRRHWSTPSASTCRRRSCRQPAAGAAIVSRWRSAAGPAGRFRFRFRSSRASGRRARLRSRACPRPRCAETAANADR